MHGDHINTYQSFCVHPKATINKNHGVDAEDKGYLIDTDRAETVTRTKLQSVQKEKGPAPL